MRSPRRPTERQALLSVEERLFVLAYPLTGAEHGPVLHLRIAQHLPFRTVTSFTSTSMPHGSTFLRSLRALLPALAAVLLAQVPALSATAVPSSSATWTVPAQGRAAYSTSRLRMRAQPRSGARVLATIPRGARITVGACSDGWCAVRYGREAGYSAERFLDDEAPSASHVIPTGNGYRNSRGEWARSPVHATSAPAGASARCRDGTYSFSRSRRGTCSHHGGVASWL
jgi:uncharacterized protein YraI